MKYDFTTVPDRKNMGSKKWMLMYEANPDVDPDVVPLSTADMEFYNAPEINQGLAEFAKNTVFGYTQATDGYLDTVVDWEKKRHDYIIEKEAIVPVDGVVPALATAIQAYTQPGEGVIIMTPVYFPFRIVTQLAKRKVVECPLKMRENRYEIDFDDLESKASDENNKLIIFCSPHNPVGRVWTREELAKVGEICLKHGVFMIDDEIHNDLIMPGNKHTVLATISEEIAKNCMVCTAPSKSFNLAGLQTSNIVIADPVKRAAFTAERLKGLRTDVNMFGMEACRLAYTYGEEWLDECIGVIDTNARYVEKFMAENLPEFPVYPLEGTYLQWVDFRALGMTHVELKEFMEKEAQFFMDEGYMFGANAKGFERFNLACPTSVIEAAMKRLLDAVNKKKNEWKQNGKPQHVTLATGDKIFDISYDTPYESGLSLVEECRKKKTILIFSRYYSCSLCQSTVNDIQEHMKEFEDRNIQIKIVMQSEPEKLKAEFGNASPYDFEIICDKERRLYKAYEVNLADPMDLMFGSDMKKTMMAMAAMPQTEEKPEGEQLQLPAVFVIDTDGSVRYANYCTTFDGLPEATELLKLI